MIQVRLPSGKLVPVDTDDPKVAAATARAFVQKDPYESAVASTITHPILGKIAGAVETAARGVPGVSELQAVGPTAAAALTGQDAGKAWTKARANQQGWVDAFKAGHPIVSNLTTGTAMAAPIAAAILTGGASDAPALPAQADAVKTGIAAFLKPAATRAAKRAVSGGVAGAVYGASQPGSLQERLGNADNGAAVGATVATVAPPALGALATGAGKAAAAVEKTVTRAANKATGGALLDAKQVASQRLVESLKADGATPDLIKEALNGFLRNGATDPSLIDVASKLPSGGQNTLALVRAAAAKGSGRGVASTYADQTAADLQGKAIDRTRQLTPDTRPATVVRDKAVAARREAATNEYREAYDQPVDARPLVPAIEGDTGRVALAAAHKDADALRLEDEMAELAKLRTAANPQPVPTPKVTIGGDEISTPGLEAKMRAQLGLDAVPADAAIPVRLGTLDRVKIALNDAGQDAEAKGLTSRAMGFYDRAKEIDSHLADQSDGYASARDNYAKASAGIDALDHGATGATAVPEDYAANLHDFLSKGGPDAGKMAAIGYRQALTDAIGAPTEGATGTLNKVSTSTNQGANLAETFGPEHAQAYREGLKDLVDQLNNARSINPNTGSATAMRLADLGLVEPPDVTPPRIGPVHLVLGAINKIRAGATLTDAERALIAKIGTAQPDLGSIDFGDHLQLPPSAALRNLQSLALGAEAGDDQKRYSQ